MNGYFLEVVPLSDSPSFKLSIPHPSRSPISLSKAKESLNCRFGIQIQLLNLCEVRGAFGVKFRTSLF